MYVLQRIAITKVRIIVEKPKIRIFVDNNLFRMKRIVCLLLTTGLLFSCSSNPFHKDYQTRLESNEGTLKPFMTLPQGISAQEREAMEFLYAYMPLADVTDYTPDFYLANVRKSFQAREEMPWKVPEREFRHFVLPLRTNNEDLDSARLVFYDQLKPRVEKLSMKEAILEVNHWCHEKMTYQPSDGRTHAPLASLKNALGRCGEESTFCVAALRSVGIPARQVYTPRWAHTESNHAWVEAWADGQWYFIGACEPEPVLNLGWFNAPASRAMLTHTKVFGKYDGPEEVVLRTPGYTEINLIENYAKAAKARLQVVSAQGKPVEGARVSFCIYNSSQFFPAVAKYTDKKGTTSLSAGLGDMLVWASKDGNYGFKKVRFGQDKDVTIVLDNPTGHPVSSQLLAIVPPPEDVQLPEVTPEQRADNDRRMAYEDSVRKAYMAGFPTREVARAFVAENGLPEAAVRLVEASAGNGATIMGFLKEASDKERAVQLLQTLSRKDLSDVSAQILWDSYNATESILGPRIESEFLSPYKGWFLRNVPAYLQEQFRGNAQAILDWVDANITVDEDPLFWDIPMSPVGVWLSRLANPRSRDLLAMALGRTFGVEMRRDRFTSSLRHENDKADVPGAPVELTYEPVEGVESPEYGSHYSVSRIADGELQMVFLGYGRGPRRFGFAGSNELPEGDYLLASGNRLSDGSTPVTVTLFHVTAGEPLQVPIVIETVLEEVKVVGHFPVKNLPAEASEGWYAAAVLDVGLEPTNHVLNDLSAEREALEKWGRPIFLVATSEAQMERLHQEIDGGRFGTLPSNVVFLTNAEGNILSAIIKGAGLREGQLPVVFVGNQKDEVVFVSQGYTIGMGAKIAALAKKL